MEGPHPTPRPDDGLGFPERKLFNPITLFGSVGSVLVTLTKRDMVELMY